MKRKLIKIGEDWILPLEKEEIEALNINPESDFINFILSIKELIIKKIEKRLK